MPPHLEKTKMLQASEEVRSSFMRNVVKDKAVGTFKNNVFPLIKKQCLKAGGGS